MGSVVLLDQVINGLQLRVCGQHGIVQGGHSLLKRCSVRVNKVDMLLILGLVFGLSHSILPSVLLGALHDLETLFGCLTLKQVNTFFIAKNFYTSVIAITLITSC